jgi:lipopolysaccharide/colanic/teichoic acid biosynthesis glycosyltransferase
MIQRSETTVPEPDTAPTATAEPTSAPTVWGLQLRQLHDAFWHARGVQCVVRGRQQPLQRAAELYLLLEPDQMVVFNIAELSERLTWHNASVTRLRIVNEPERGYRERVVLGPDGLVRRIERIYRPRSRGASRIVLTSSRRVASIWMAAATWREGWDRVRRSVPWERVDHQKCPGRTAMQGNAERERVLLNELVERWPTPAQAIDGIEEAEAGVWRIEGEAGEAGAVRIGPLWLGRGVARAHHRCLIGPRWLADVDDGSDTGALRPVKVRRIAEVELAEAPGPGESRPIGQTYAFFKRAMDVAVSAVALLVMLPLFPIVAVLIVMEDGLPLFFGHDRQGRGGRPFKCWKFRTMHRNAVDIARELEEYNRADGPQVYIQDDPRVTRVGAWLRKTHVDEFPQFYNVLVGHMSLVGPRPSPDDENQFCPAWRDTRLSVRPGITGLWQLERTREPGEDFQEWIRYDIEYVRRADFWLDVQILLRTARLFFRGRPERGTE